MAQGLIAANKLIAEKNKQIEVMKPKALFADAVSSSRTSILIRDLAKLIKQNGIDIGQNRLYEWLRDKGYLIKKGSDKNMPTQKAMNLNLFEIKVGSYINGQGANVVTRTPKVTGKGQVYFVNKFLAE
jgi:anti-repressor protein